MRTLIWTLLIIAVFVVAWEYYRPPTPVDERIATVVDLQTPTTNQGDTVGENHEQQGDSEELPPSPSAPLATTQEATGNQAIEEPASVMRYQLVGSPTVERIGRRVGGQHKGVVPVSGDVFVQDTPLSLASGTLYIDMSRIEATSVDNDGLNQTLKSSEYFDAADHPQAVFRFLSYENGKITGLLTIKGTTKQIIFPATVSVEEDTVTANASFALDRTERGIRGGLPAISPYIEIEFSLVRQAVE